MSDSPRAMRPCPFAIAAMTVPSRRWVTRADLTNQLSKAEIYIRTCPVEGFSVENAAAVAGISLHHFIRLFRSVYSISPHQAFAERRFALAKSLLAKPKLTVLEVGMACGFKDASAFARYFKKASGISPSGYRKSI